MTQENNAPHGADARGSVQDYRESLKREMRKTLGLRSEGKSLQQTQFEDERKNAVREGAARFLDAIIDNTERNADQSAAIRQVRAVVAAVNDAIELDAWDRTEQTRPKESAPETQSAAA